MKFPTNPIKLMSQTTKRNNNIDYNSDSGDNDNDNIDESDVISVVCECRWKGDDYYNHIEWQMNDRHHHKSKCTATMIKGVDSSVTNRYMCITESNRIIESLVLPPLTNGFYVRIDIPLIDEYSRVLHIATWTPTGPIKTKSDAPSSGNCHADPWIFSNLKEILCQTAVDECDRILVCGFTDNVRLLNGNVFDDSNRIRCTPHRVEVWSSKYFRQEEFFKFDPELKLVEHKQRHGSPPEDEQRVKYVLYGNMKNHQGDPAWVKCIMDVLDFRPNFPHEWNQTLSHIRRELERTNLNESCIIMILKYLPMWIAYTTVPTSDAIEIGSGVNKNWKFPALDYNKQTRVITHCGTKRPREDEQNKYKDEFDDLDEFYGSDGFDGGEDQEVTFETVIEVTKKCCKISVDTVTSNGNVNKEKFELEASF